MATRSIAYFVAAVTLLQISSALPQNNFQQQYPSQGYNQYQPPQQQLYREPQQQQYQPQFQQQQQQFQQQFPQPQHQQQFQQPQHQQPPQQAIEPPQKVTGYEPQDVIPSGVSPLKNLDESQSNRKYVDFINQLYRFDRTKPSLHHQAKRSVDLSLDPVSLAENVNEQSSRKKRALVFRPMFVYRQQKVRKEKVKQEREEAAASKTNTVSANQAQLYKDKRSNVYREYNSFYEPYRYGQRFPYRNY